MSLLPKVLRVRYSAAAKDGRRRPHALRRRRFPPRARAVGRRSNASAVSPFRIRAASPAAVHSFAERIRRDGFEIVGQWDEPEYVSVKVRDPDGYVVEVACDPTAS